MLGVSTINIVADWGKPQPSFYMGFLFCNSCRLQSIEVLPVPQKYSLLSKALPFLDAWTEC